eukprot:m.40646 g.40646  ORF g.40646 m.40646 type:complete len:70 (-) comp10451_c0_seq4:2036-2245(-)
MSRKNAAVCYLMGLLAFLTNVCSKLKLVNNRVWVALVEAHSTVTTARRKQLFSCCKLRQWIKFRACKKG